MKSYHSKVVIWVALPAVVFLSACGALAQEPMPTSTSTPTPTKTPRPTATLTPSPTPDVAATQRSDELSVMLNSFVEKGYLDSAEGSIIDLVPTWQEYQGGDGGWWAYDEDMTDFLFSAHYDWKEAAGDIQSLGCEVSFADWVQGDQNHYYHVYFDKSRIWVEWVEFPPGTAYWFGKTRGNGRVNFGDRTEADFVLLVKGQTAYVSIDREITEYTLPDKWIAEGKIHLSRVPWGAECQMTDMMLWTPKEP